MDWASEDSAALAGDSVAELALNATAQAARALLSVDDDEYPDFVDLEAGKLVGLVLVGLFVGFVGGFAGIGGAPIMVSSLTFLGYCQREAQGTVMATSLPPITAPGIRTMWDRALIMWRYAVPAVLTYMTFSYLGATLAYVFEDQAQLSILFGCFLCGLGLRYFKNFVFMWHDTHQKTKAMEPAVRMEHLHVELEKGAVVAPAEHHEQDAPPSDATPPPKETKAEKRAREMNADGPTIVPRENGKADWPLPFTYTSITLIGAVVGTVGGLFGVGAGVLMVPCFTDLAGLHKDDARIMSLLILAPPVGLGGVIKYSSDGDCDFLVALVLLVAYTISNAAGARLGSKVSTTMFKLAFGQLLFVLGVILIVFATNDLAPDRCED